MASSTVHAQASCVVTHNGVVVTIREGDKYPEDDPLVRAFQWLFRDSGVEQATAAPGEKRATRRQQ